MTSISGVNAGAALPMAAAEKALETPTVQKADAAARSRPPKPVMDEYVPEEKQEPSGRYWIGRDEAGRPKICFDGPVRAADGPKEPEDAPGAKQPGRHQRAGGPEKKGEKKERCVCSTDQVDREIENLKKRRERLEQRLNTETDEARIKELERQLAQVERELSEKDNDAYRKQHSTFTQLS